MGQVPRKYSYLLVGRGRLATHLRHYFQLENLSFITWDRSEPVAALYERAQPATHVLLPISDPAIEPFVLAHRDLFADKVVTHFSGALATPLAESAHPLMTFTRDLYDLATYRQIPFICEQGRRPFHELLPGLANPHFTIPGADKTLYHALCVLSGNFTVLLWQKMFTELESRWGLPAEAAYPYLKRVTANLQNPETSALTGPLARGDRPTIDKHLRALQGDAFEGVYQAFVEAFRSQAKLGAEGTSAPNRSAEPSPEPSPL